MEQSSIIGECFMEDLLLREREEYVVVIVSVFEMCSLIVYANFVKSITTITYRGGGTQTSPEMKS
jgi:hypothetical protein